MRTGKTIIGTSHFRHREDAMEYYSPYFFPDLSGLPGTSAKCIRDEVKYQLRVYVDEKLKNGEIHIGVPETTGSQVAFLVNEMPGWRWYIEETAESLSITVTVTGTGEEFGLTPTHINIDSEIVYADDANGDLWVFNGRKLAPVEGNRIDWEGCVDASMETRQ